MFFREWLIYAVMAMACWGGVNVLDTFFVEEEIYDNANEGIIISSLFKIIGFFLVGGIFFEEAIGIGFDNAFLAMMAGVMLSVAFWFYFKAAFLYNDLSLVQIFWNLSIPLIAILSWILMGEKLQVISYLGIGIVFFGAVIVSFSKESANICLEKFFLIIIPLVICYSFAEIIMKYMEEVKTVGFWGSFPYVCLGQFLFGTVLLVFDWKAFRSKHLFRRVVYGNWRLFVLSEIIELGGVFFMMLAIAKTPSVTLFSVTESFMPLVVIVMTGLTGFIMKFLGKSDSLNVVYKKNHIAGIWGKILATVVMAVGIYLIE